MCGGEGVPQRMLFPFVILIGQIFLPEQVIFCRTLPFSLARIELAQHFTLDLQII